MTERVFSIGIDIDDKYAVASYFVSGMKEPETVSMITGSEVFQIPVLITKKEENSQWVIGEDTAYLTEIADELLGRALRQEEVVIAGECCLAETLLFHFLRKLIGYACSMQGMCQPEVLAIAVEELTEEMAKLLLRLGEQLGFQKEQIILLDRKSAFYYFALNQQEELWRQDVCLYDYRENVMKCLYLKRNAGTIPQIVTIQEYQKEIDMVNKDESFYHFLQEHMKGKIISSVYLVGGAFDGGWMKLSLEYLCRGRRAFMGKNLYAKGACYATLAAQNILDWKYTYLSDNVIKMNVNLKVRNCGVEEFHSLLDAGTNWYDAKGSCQVILDTLEEVSIWLQMPNSKKAKVETLQLTDLPERKNRTTRLLITAKPLSDVKVQIQIKDMGFGEIVKSSGMIWEYEMSL